MHQRTSSLYGLEDAEEDGTSRLDYLGVPQHDEQLDLLEMQERGQKSLDPLSRSPPSSSDLYRSLMLSILAPLAPSFLRQSAHHAPRKLYPTSYLDGLRGVSAFIVVIHHYAYEFTSISPQGWHTGEPGSHDYLFLLPLVRIIHSGRFMVVIFFVISGYVLSYRGLQSSREGKAASLLESLSSSVFRRWLRLHLPVVISTFVAFVLARAGLWVNLPPDWNHSGGNREPRWYPNPEGTLLHNLKDWWLDTLALIDPFRYGAFAVSRYNINILWTIPTEWIGSMVVFSTVLGLARVQTWAKISILCGLIYWCHFNARWETATFLSGVLLAELSFQRPRYIKHPLMKEYLSSRIFWTILFLLGIYIGSHPQLQPETAPGYRTLMSFTPSWYEDVQEHPATNPKTVFWLALGGPIIIFALEHAKFLQDLFTTPFAQYLGDISFSLYMLHFQIMCTMGHWLIPKCMNLTGGWSNGHFGFMSGIALAMVVLLPATFWASDVFSRFVDVKCVKFAKWVSEKTFIT